MFWSESLLARNGPLARVWLASNLEKKLSKQNILSESIETKVQDIIGTGQAPLALRLSGQLLLGVARIYSRKAQYLMHDCNEALIKIKMAFRPGNVDLPSNTNNKAHAADLLLPDTITDLDLLAPLPDPDVLLLETETTHAPGRDPTMLDFGTSQLLPDSQTPTRRKEKSMLLEDIDLGLDLGLDIGEGPGRSMLSDEVDRSIEIGRRAETTRRDEPTLLMDDDLGLDLGLGDSTMQPPIDEDVPMAGVDDGFHIDADVVHNDQIAAANAAALARVDAATERRQRDTASPLSSIRSSTERDLERTFQFGQSHLTAEQEEEVAQAAQRRVKRRRVMAQDAETELHNSQIKAQQNDRSAITKAPSFLPRDPLLLQLMEMQRNGSFVSNIMGDGRMRGWAPELRGILSIDVVRKAGEKKRKRDSGIADVETASERQTTPNQDLNHPEHEDEGFQLDGTNDFNMDPNLLYSDGLQPPQPQDAPDLDPSTLSIPAFDTTEAPLLHPSHSGPISLATQSAVQLLRSHFAPDHPLDAAIPPTPSKRTKAEALFTDLCPEDRTTKTDATKMFFEILVLGTKDAVKVEQDVGEGVGGKIRVRGKRGLWGTWGQQGATPSHTEAVAEEAAGDELA